MTVLSLDETLTEAQWNEKYFPRKQIKSRIEQQCIAGDAVRRDWKARTITETEIVFASAPAFPPLNYEKKDGTIVLSLWRAPERLFDEPDELVIWARAALAAARWVAAKTPRRGERSRRQ
jgi:hypothetical protein